MVFSKLENVICQKNIHICANILTNIKWRIFTSMWVDQNGVFYTYKCFLIEEYTPLYELTEMVLFILKTFLEILIYLKNIHLCASVFQLFSMEEYLPPCELTIMVFLHFKLFLPQVYIQGVPKRIRLGFCLLSRQPGVTFLNCCFLLKTEIHTQILNPNHFFAILGGRDICETKWDS